MEMMASIIFGANYGTSELQDLNTIIAPTLTNSEQHFLMWIHQEVFDGSHSLSLIWNSHNVQFCVNSILLIWNFYKENICISTVILIWYYVDTNYGGPELQDWSYWNRCKLWELKQIMGIPNTHFIDANYGISELPGLRSIILEGIINLPVSISCNSFSNAAISSSSLSSLSSLGKNIPFHPSLSVFFEPSPRP